MRAIYSNTFRFLPGLSWDTNERLYHRIILTLKFAFIPIAIGTVLALVGKLFRQRSHFVCARLLHLSRLHVGSITLSVPSESSTSFTFSTVASLNLSQPIGLDFRQGNQCLLECCVAAPSFLDTNTHHRLPLQFEFCVSTKVRPIDGLMPASTIILTLQYRC